LDKPNYPSTSNKREGCLFVVAELKDLKVVNALLKDNMQGAAPLKNNFKQLIIKWTP
jgi:hypothetical protein